MPAPRVIAVVDDDESFRESICSLLRAHGFLTRGFVSAETLLEQRGWLAADCLLVDATLPGVAGPELLLDLRSRRVDCPVILMSGYDQGDLGGAATEAGALACLVKPFDVQELLGLLEVALPGP